MVGSQYWSTGITITPHEREAGVFEWSVSANFLDGGFCDLASTEGTFAVRYMVKQDQLIESVQLLRADMERMGIHFGVGLGSEMLPSIYIEGDGEHRDVTYPDNWREIVEEVAGAMDGFRGYETLPTVQSLPAQTKRDPEYCPYCGGSHDPELTCAALKELREVAS